MNLNPYINLSNLPQARTFAWERQLAVIFDTVPMYVFACLDLPPTACLYHPQVNRDNAKLYNNVGHALESQKRLQEALIFFKEAAR